MRLLERLAEKAFRDLTDKGFVVEEQRTFLLWPYDAPVLHGARARKTHIVRFTEGPRAFANLYGPSETFPIFDSKDVHTFFQKYHKRYGSKPVRNEVITFLAQQKGAQSYVVGMAVSNSGLLYKARYVIGDTGVITYR